MEIKDYLAEIVKDETTLDRKLEISTEIMNVFSENETKYNELVENTSKLQDDYKKLQAKKVDEFFNKGNEFQPDEYSNNEKDVIMTPDEIAKELMGGKI